MRAAVIVSLLLLLTSDLSAELPLDEAPAKQSEWGYRPADRTVSQTSSPNFAWRPQRGIVRWQLQCGGDETFDQILHDQDDIQFNVHTPSTSLPPGTYYWRYRGFDPSDEVTSWSRTRQFSIPTDAQVMPMPTRDQLLGRIPEQHPRLFVRPEQMPKLRQLAQTEMAGELHQLVQQCERLLKNPPPTAEPPKYGPGVKSHDEQWRKIWWGNRVYTTNALNGAATLAFTRLLNDNQEYGQLARRILLECAQWDPKGATGYRYNDEAGMPYAYYFSRTYSFVHDLLTEEERQVCRDVMRIRGEEMYKHLCPRHLWSPYSSHSNRAWHFLGEVGIAFRGEIEQADDWVWFAMNVFYNVYPVWCDDDGGWHEGTAYWSSYVSRFTWWADIMRAAFGIDAYQKSYFHSIGSYPMYLMPPGKVGGGLGDLTANRKSSSNVPLMSTLAAQAGNSHWQWYVEAHGGARSSGGYVGFVRGALPTVQAVPPTDLPASKLFRGTGQAYLNTTLENAKEDVQVVFKSSPFGTQSHGYEANNSFLLSAYGQRLLIRSGYRDIYGSDHHRNWMWSTRSVNNITVGGGGGQLRRHAAALGRITYFRTTPTLDVVAGEAAEAYRESTDVNHDSRLLDRYTRTVIFVKPELVIVYDRLVARQPNTFEYWLHATKEFEIGDGQSVTVRAGDVVCPITFLAPDDLQLSQTDQYDPNPRSRIRLREWHLTAKTPTKRKRVEFVAIYRPHRDKTSVPDQATLRPLEGGYELTVEIAGGRVVALLPIDESASLTGSGLSTTGAIIVQRRDEKDTVVETIDLTEKLMTER